MTKIFKTVNIILNNAEEVRLVFAHRAGCAHHQHIHITFDGGSWGVPQFVAYVATNSDFKRSTSTLVCNIAGRWDTVPKKINFARMTGARIWIKSNVAIAQFQFVRHT